MTKEEIEEELIRLEKQKQNLNNDVVLNNWLFDRIAYLKELLNESAKV